MPPIHIDDFLVTGTRLRSVDAKEPNTNAADVSQNTDTLKEYKTMKLWIAIFALLSLLVLTSCGHAEDSSYTKSVVAWSEYRVIVINKCGDDRTLAIQQSSEGDVLLFCVRRVEAQ